jgi:hypothetical protein
VLEEEGLTTKWASGRSQQGQKFKHLGRIWNYSAKYKFLLLQNHFKPQITRFSPLTKLLNIVIHFELDFVADGGQI